MHIPAPGGTLHLDSLPHEIQGEGARLGQHAGHGAGHGAARAEGQLQAAEGRTQGLVGGEEETHVRDDLGHAGGQAAEEATQALLAVDLPHGPPQARVDAVVALGGKPGAEEVERVGHRRGDSAAHGTSDEGLGRLGEGALAEGGVQEEGGRAVGGELDRAVAHVEQLGGHVALPEAGQALMAEDVADRREGALVDGPALQVAVREGVREGVRLELEADLDDVERSDDEATGVSGVSTLFVMYGRMENDTGMLGISAL